MKKLLDDHRPAKDGEYADLMCSLGFFRKIGYNQNTLLAWIKQERYRVTYDHECRLKNLADLETRILEGIRE